MINGRFLVIGTLVLSSVACADRGDDSQTQQSRLDDEGAVKPASNDSFTIDLATTAPAVDLGKSVDIDVTVTPAKGFAGSVDLNVTGLPVGVTAEPVNVSLARGAVTTKVTLTAAVTAYVTPKDSTVAISVTGTSGKESVTAAAGFKVMPKLTIYIPNNIALLYVAAGGPLRPEWGEAFGPNNQPLHTQPGNGIEITIFNNDTKAHILHGNGGPWQHGDFNAPIQPGAFELKNGAPRIRTMNVGDTTTSYIHGEPNSTNATFKVTVAATPVEEPAATP
jgi:hypothetical protein